MSGHIAGQKEAPSKLDLCHSPGWLCCWCQSLAIPLNSYQCGSVLKNSSGEQVSDSSAMASLCWYAILDSFPFRNTPYVEAGQAATLCLLLMMI